MTRSAADVMKATLGQTFCAAQGVCRRVLCLKRPCVVAARLRRLLQHFESASAAKALPHTNLALAAVTLSGMTYDRDAAPPLETTSTHVARKLLAHAAATLCAFFVLQVRNSNY